MYVMPYRKCALILAEMFSCTQCTAQGKDSELILAVKMETRHHIGGPFSRMFFGICNHLQSYDGLKLQDLDIFLSIICFFWGEGTTHYG